MTDWLTAVANYYWPDWGTCSCHTSLDSVLQWYLDLCGWGGPKRRCSCCLWCCFQRSQRHSSASRCCCTKHELSSVPYHWIPRTVQRHILCKLKLTLPCSHHSSAWPWSRWWSRWPLRSTPRCSHWWWRWEQRPARSCCYEEIAITWVKVFRRQFIVRLCSLCSYSLNRVVTGERDETSKSQGEGVEHLSTCIQPGCWIH